MNLTLVFLQVLLFVTATHGMVACCIKLGAGCIVNGLNNIRIPSTSEDCCNIFGNNCPVLRKDKFTGTDVDQITKWCSDNGSGGRGVLISETASQCECIKSC